MSDTGLPDGHRARPARPEALAHPITPARFVTVRLAAQITGLTEKAIRGKMHRGIWLEGKHWRRADGGIFIDMRAYDAWVIGPLG